MIPWFEAPTFHLGPVPVHAFGVLVMAGVLVTYFVTGRQLDAAARADYDGLALRALLAGLLGSHLVELFLYHPERLANGPMALLRFDAGMSSFGGVLGVGVAVALHGRRPGRSVRRLADAAAWGGLHGWIFGRAGCAWAHDHPGVRTDFPLAVAYPGGPRHDLGLYELALTGGIVLVLWAIRRRALPAGALFGCAAVLYAPARFGLDFLRVGDARYLGLTPAQYGCIGLVWLGARWLLRTRSD